MAIHLAGHCFRRHRRLAVVATVAACSLLLALPWWAPDRPQQRMPEASFSLNADLVDLTLVSGADKKGAVCLDGSLPAYHLQRGFGSGSDSWLLHIEGGGWCHDLESCSSRKQTMLGSSKYMERQVAFVGMLSNRQYENPDFYNWNRVKIRYCDGASFLGNGSNSENGTNLFFRGQKIWEAIMSELLREGLESAKQAFLTGCSAGGLATIIHCDEFRKLLPEVSIVKCLADGGFFIDAHDISGKSTLRAFYSDVVRFQDLHTKFHYCGSDLEPGQCFFPREILKSSTTPLFVLNSAYDAWMVHRVLVPESSDPRESWLNCKLDIQHCEPRQIGTLQGFRKAFLNSLTEVKQKKDWGMFVNSCYIHCQTMKSHTWHSPSSPRINNKTIAESVGDWFFDRREVRDVDCEYPCNPTCYNMVFTAFYRQ